MSLINEARRRQRRRRTAIGAVVLASAIAALAAAIAGGGGGGSRSSTTGPAHEDSGRPFAKYGLPCWAFREASLSTGPPTNRWCKPTSTGITWRAGAPANVKLPLVSCTMLRKAGIPVGPNSGQGCMFHYAFPPQT